MFEDRCHLIDLKLSVYMAINNKTINETDFDKFVENHKKLKYLEKSIANFEEKIVLIKDALSVAILREPENEKEVKITYKERINYFQAKIDEKVYMLTITSMEETVVNKKIFVNKLLRIGPRMLKLASL